MAREPAAMERSPVGQIDVYMQALKVLAGYKSFDVRPSGALAGAGLRENIGKDKSRRNRFRKLNRSRAGEDKGGIRDRKHEGAASKSFWGYVEDYFRDVNQEDVLFLRSLVSREYDPAFQIPPLGKPCGANLDKKPTEKDALLTKEVEDPLPMSSPKRKLNMPNLLKKKRVKSMPLASGTSDPNLAESPHQDCVSKRGAAQTTIISPPMEGDEELCDVCYSGYSVDEDVIIFCDSCDVAVHQQCYGISSIPEGDWFCASCNSESQGDTECILCCERGGAMKPVSVGNHNKLSNGIDPHSLANPSKSQMAHLFCSQWIPETFIENTVTMEPILNIEGISKERWKLMCSLCKKRKGACIQCCYGHCAVAFHPLCARKANLLMIVSSKESGDGHDFQAFCAKHSKVQKLKMDEFINEQNRYEVETPDMGEAFQEDTGKSMEETGECNLVKETNVKRQGTPDSRLNLYSNDTNGYSAKDHTLHCGNHFSDHSPQGTHHFKKQKTDPLLPHHSVYFIQSNDLNHKAQSLPKAEHEPISLPMTGEGSTESQPILARRCNESSGAQPSPYPIKDRGLLAEDSAKKESESERDEGKNGTINGSEMALSLTQPLNEDCEDTVDSNRDLCKEKNEMDMLYTANQYISQALSSFLFQILLLNRSSPCIDSQDRFRTSSPYSVSILTDEFSKQKDEGRSNQQALKNVVTYFFPFVSSSTDEFSSPMASSNFNLASEFENSKGEEKSQGDLTKNFVKTNGRLNQITEKTENCQSSKDSEDKNDDSLTEQWRKIELAKKLGMDSLCPKDEIGCEILIKQAQLLQLLPSNRNRIDDLMMRIVPSLESQRLKERKRMEDKSIIDLYKLKKRELNRQSLKERREKEALQTMTAAKAAIKYSSRPVHLRRTITIPKSHPLSQKDYLTDLNSILSPPHSSDLSPLASPHLYHPSPSSPRTEAMSQDFSRERMRSRAVISKPISVRLGKDSQASDSGLVSKPTSLRILGPTPPSIPKQEALSPAINDADDHKATLPSCAVCGGSVFDTSNESVICANCQVCVHQHCYGILFPKRNWICQVCNKLQNDLKTEPLSPSPSAASVSCFLCSMKGGALKVSVDDHYVHVICVQWFPEASLGMDENHYVKGLDQIPSEKFGLTCLLCNKRDGACINCNFGRCTKSFHASCAFAFGLFMPSKLFSNGKYSRRAYCERHSSIQRERIVSKRQDGVEELSHLRILRANLERFRSICILINRRERKKKEILDCLKDVALERIKSESIVRQGSMTITEHSLSSHHNFSPIAENSVSLDGGGAALRSAKQRRSRTRPSKRKLQNLTALSSDSSLLEPSGMVSETNDPRDGKLQAKAI